MARASRSMSCFNSGEEASCEARTLMALRPYHPHRTGIGFQGDQVSRPASMPSVRVIIRAPPLEGNSDSRRSVGDGTTSQVSCPHMSAAWYQATLLPGPALLLDTFNFSAMLEAFVFFHRLHRHDSNEPMQATCIDCCQRKARNTRPIVQPERNEKHHNEERTQECYSGNMSVLTSAPAKAVQRIVQEADIEVQERKGRALCRKGRMRRF